MTVTIAREANGEVSITVKDGHAITARVTPVEARLLAIKILLASEDLRSVDQEHSR